MTIALDPDLDPLDLDLKKSCHDWVNLLGIETQGDAWSLQITLSTVPMSHWLYQQHLLQPSDLKLELTVTQWGKWIATLSTHNHVLKVQWLPKKHRVVDSIYLKYRQLIQWPTLEVPFDFPSLIADIEKQLDIKFIKHVNIDTRQIDFEQSILKNILLKQWLSPFSISIGQGMK